MTREELKKEVKEIIAKGCGCVRYCLKNPDDCGCAKDADAAIAIVLEEAAKVADETGSGSYDAIHIAAAIRALGVKK